MLDFLLQTGLPFTVVLTKSDKLNKTEREQRRRAFAENPYLRSAIQVIEASAQNGEGMKELKEIIEKAVSDELEAEKIIPVTVADEPEAEESIPEAPAVVRATAVRKKRK